MSTKYVNVEKVCEMFNRYFHQLAGNEAQTLVCDMKQAFLELPTEDLKRPTATRGLHLGHRHYCSSCGKLAYCENYCSNCGAEIVSPV